MGLLRYEKNGGDPVLSRALMSPPRSKIFAKVLRILLRRVQAATNGSPQPDSEVQLVFLSIVVEIRNPIRDLSH